MEADAPPDRTALIGDRYQLGELVGRGGMAQVYRAHDQVLGRAVAVKLMRAFMVGDEERARFTDEARVLAQLSHPGLVTVLDAATNDDEPYLVMELVDGPSLAECCRGTTLEPERVAAIGAQLADALGHVHAAGIVHRDLKPGNVLLDADDRARLTDFGLARIMSAALRHTTSGAMVGTPAYLAPEQVRGDEVTPAADVYSLGLVLIEALTGVCPYRGLLPIEVALARLSTSPPVPDTLSRPWQSLLRAMTATEPSARPSTAEVGDALRALASGHEPQSSVLRRVAADHWPLAVGVTAGVLLVVLTAVWFGGGGGTVGGRSQPPAVVGGAGAAGAAGEVVVRRAALPGPRGSGTASGDAAAAAQSGGREVGPATSRARIGNTDEAVDARAQTPVAGQPQVDVVAGGAAGSAAQGDAGGADGVTTAVPPDTDDADTTTGGRASSDTPAKDDDVTTGGGSNGVAKDNGNGVANANGRDKDAKDKAAEQTPASANGAANANATAIERSPALD